jgi:hypothetical protein
MDGLVANNPLEDVGRARPSDALHHQKAAIEPGIEEMDEVVLDADQVRVAVPMLNQIFAHTHQRSGAARSQIETAEQLLAGRLHRPQERLKAARVRSLIVASPSGAKLLLVGVEVMRKKAKEVETLFHSKAGVEVEDLTGERHPRGFPAARQQIPAEGLEVLRRPCLLGCALTPIRGGAGGRAFDEGAAAVSDAAQHVVEETRAH